MSHTYTYSIANDTANGIADGAALFQAITDPSNGIGKQLSNVSTSGDDLNITFKQILAALEKTELDGIVAAHDGQPLDDIQLISLNENKDDAGHLITASNKPIGNFDTLVTQNLCVDATLYKIEPSPGKIIDVVKAEVQFEHDINISNGGNEIYLDYFIWHPDYPGTPVQAQRITFDSIRTVFEYGNAHYHSPALPEISNGLSTVVFDYVRKLQFFGDETPLKLAKLEISTKSGIITGSYATVGFVVEERDA